MLIVVHDHEPVAVPLVVALSDSHAIELDNVAMFSALVHHFDLEKKRKAERNKKKNGHERK